MPNTPLSVGTYGGEVSRLQEALVADGFQISASEISRRFFGPSTRRAVQQFQQARGLAVSGAVDAATAGALSAGVSSKPAPGGADAPVPAWSSSARSARVSAAAPSRTTGGRTVAALLCDYLVLEGATRVFGVPGGAVVYLLEELKRRQGQFEFFVCRHETGAAYIAHGYASVSGALGVVLTTTGPSATNALTGAMNAQTSNCSLLTITGEVPQQYFGESYLQEGADARLDIGVVYRNAVEYSAVVSSEKNFATLFTQALRVARSQPPRAAHISLPNDIAGTCVTGDDPNDPSRLSFPQSPRAYRAVPRGTDIDRVRMTFHELVAANRPLIFLGNGARQALADRRRLRHFTQFVERFAIPVMTTPDAKGIFPESHPLSLRNYGMCACSWPDVYMGEPGTAIRYDALLVLGSSLGELATSVVARDQFSKRLIPTSTFVQVDLDQNVIGRVFPVTRGIVADVGSTIDAMCEVSDAHRPDPTNAGERWRLIGEIKASHSPFADPRARASDASPLHPAALMRVVNEVVSDGHIFIDAGNCVGWSLNNLVIDPPVRFHSALGMGPMGFGVGAVIGGRIAAPDKPCVGLVGDGAFLMHGAEVSTAARYGVGAVWVVLQDNDLAMVSQGMGELFPPPGAWARYYDLGAPDLVRFSEGLGGQAVSIEREQGPTVFAAVLQTAIRQADARRPQVIIVNIDTAAVPPYSWPALPANPCQ
jgi:acetolactate synthase-1/2/3 large subunit